MILKEFSAVSRILDTKGFFAGSLSEISLRTSGGKMLVTPGGKPICKMTEESGLTAAIDGAGKGREIYQHSMANAVVLCQPDFACIMSRQGREPEKDIFINANELLEITKCVKVQDIHFDEGVGDQGVLLIDSVGVLTWGSDLDTLIARIEILERFCEISIASTR